MIKKTLLGPLAFALAGFTLGHLTSSLLRVQQNNSATTFNSGNAESLSDYKARLKTENEQLNKVFNLAGKPPLKLGADVGDFKKLCEDMVQTPEFTNSSNNTEFSIYFCSYGEKDVQPWGWYVTIEVNKSNKIVKYYFSNMGIFEKRRVWQ